MQPTLKIIVFVWFSSMHMLNAQSKIDFLEGNFSILQPAGFLKKNMPEVKFGVEAGYLRQIKINKPLFWGISIYYHPLENASATLAELLDFRLVDFDYVTTTNLLGFNGKFRFYPQLSLGKTELYLEAVMGYKWLFAVTTKTLSSDIDSSDSDFEKGSLSLTYGLACGLNIPLNHQLYINARANYLPGLSTSYYVQNENNILSTSSIDLFDLKKSTTDVIRWDIGVTWRITKSEE